MIVLYNFVSSHMGLACTGLGDQSFYFGFNTTERGTHQDAKTAKIMLRPVIYPFFDQAHYFSTSHPTRIGIPTVEDGNVYGPSERAIYEWIFLGNRAYATIVPTGPLSLFDWIWHGPSRITRLITRPIEKSYLPLGLGLLPLIDSAHCLDFVRWMLRVAFWNRDHREHPGLLSEHDRGSPRGAGGSATSDLHDPTWFQKKRANNSMRLAYYLVSISPGLNTLGSWLFYEDTAKRLRNHVIAANRHARLPCRDGIMLEAPGAGTYGMFFGRRFSPELARRHAHESEQYGAMAPRDTLFSTAFQGGFTRNKHPISYTEWEVYQYWANQFCDYSSGELRYKPCETRRTYHLRDYFRTIFPSDRIYGTYSRTQAACTPQRPWRNWRTLYYGNEYDHEALCALNNEFINSVDLEPLTRFIEAIS